MSVSIVCDKMICGWMDGMMRMRIMRMRRRMRMMRFSLEIDKK